MCPWPSNCLHDPSSKFLDQLPPASLHPCKNRTHSTCFCSTRGHTPTVCSAQKTMEWLKFLFEQHLPKGQEPGEDVESTLLFQPQTVTPLEQHTPTEHPASGPLSL